MDLWRLPPAELLARLETTREGLSGAEAAARLGRFGPNVIERRKKKNYVREYLVQYTQFFALLLEVAAFLSFVASYYAPGEGYHILGYAIAGAVVVNASFAFWQEYKADRTVEALLKLVPRLARVRRGNELMKVAVHVLVPGDILFLEAGDRIGADAVLLEDHSLYVNIATLTGESRPVQRSAGSDGAEVALEAKNLVFAGTTVVSGNGTAVVYATGGGTEFGRIATLTGEVSRRLTPMQLEVIRITRILTIAALLVGAVFFVLGFLAGEGFLIAAIFALSLIVANVPEGMLPTITLSLSLASQRMARRNALIKNLDSVQTLGSATVICTDKTGTITLNEMTLKEVHLTSGEKVVFTGEGYLDDGEYSIEPEGPGSRERLVSFLEAAMKNCTAKIQEESVFGDPTELAILAAARKADVAPECLPEHRQYPFTSERKMMSTVFAHDGGMVLYSKGALEVLLPLSVAWVGADGSVGPLGDAERQQMVERAEALERKAYRVLAVARADGQEERDLVMLGLVAIKDLPRPEVKGAVARCLNAGIRVMMLTGDNPLTAAAVAESIGLPVDCVLSGRETRSLSDERLSELLRDKDVLFARMRSEQKLRIATLLQQNGEVVAMTGDGVNDAPALRKADIGISMGIKGTEVAKEAADMILLDDNFASIVSAVEEGRTVYFNIKKFVTYILSSNIPEIVPYILFFFLRIPLPLSVIQILSIDLGSDMLPGLALGSEPPEDDIMNRPPVGRDERILDREVFRRGYFFLGLIEGAAAMSAFLGFLFLMGWQYGDLPVDPELHRQAMTMTLLGAISCQLVNVWTLRSWENPAAGRGLFSNRLLIVAIVIEFLWIFALLNIAAVQEVFNTAAVPAPFLLLLVPFPVLLFVSHEYYKYRLRMKRAGLANPAP